MQTAQVMILLINNHFKKYPSFLSVCKQGLLKTSKIGFLEEIKLVVKVESEYGEKKRFFRGLEVVWILSCYF